MAFLDNILKKVFGISTDSSFLGWSFPGAFTKKKVLNEYRGYLYSIISAIATDVGRVNLQAKKNTKDGHTEVVNDHDVLQLLKKPNEDYSQFQFIELHETYFSLMGESFWYLVNTKRTRKPTQIHLLRPDMVDVSVDKEEKSGKVTGYVLRRAGKEDITFETDEILHFKMPNPKNPYRGLGPIEAAKTYVETEKYASEWTRNSIYNSGRPSGIVSLKGVIDDDQFKQLKKRFKQEYSGTENAGKTMLLKGSDGIDYQKLGVELSEVALKELKDMTRDDLMFMFRASKTIMGITDDVNRATAREASSVWTENVIKPRLDRLVDHLNAFLLPRYSGNAYLTYVDPNQGTIEEKLEEWKEGHNKWLTTNDIRSERGLDPIEGGDTIYQRVGSVPIDDSGNFFNKQEEDKNKKKDVRLFKTKASKLRQAEAFRQELYANQREWSGVFKKKIDGIFRQQEEDIMQMNKKSFEEWLFDKEKYNRIFLQVLSPLYIELMVEQGNLALNFAGDDDTDFRISEQMKRYIRERVGLFADGVNEQTIDEIRDTIAEGIEAGENLGDMRGRIHEVFVYATDIRSKRISRTETIAGSNEATLEAYRQSPAVKAQEWYAQPTACEFCEAIDGKIIGLNEEFLTVGDTIEGVDGGVFSTDFMDVTHPPLHPNCECAIMPVDSYELARGQLADKVAKYGDLDKRTSEAKKLKKEINKLKKKIE